MATERVNSQVSIQPTPLAENPEIAAQGAAARQRAGAATSDLQTVQQVGQIATGFLRDQALKQARDDAAGIVEYDKDGNLLIPKNFDAPIGGGLLYMQGYHEAATAAYKSAAVGEFQRKAQALQAQFPTDPEAISKGLEEYREAKIKAMPPGLGDQLLPHFESARAQATTGAAANRQKVAFDVMRREAGAELERWSNGVAALETSKARGAYDPQSYTQQQKLLDETWSRYEQMARQSGMVDAEIQHNRQTAQVQGKARVLGDEISARIAGSGQYAPVVQGEIQQKMEAFIRENPGHEAIIRAEFSKAISRGQAVAGGTVASQDLTKQDYDAKRGEVELYRNQERQRITREVPGDQQQAALAELNAEAERRLAAITTSAATSNMRPLQKVATALAAFDAQDAGTARMVSTQVARQINVLQDVQAPLAQKSQALTDLQQLSKDPNFVAFTLASTQGQYLGRTVQSAVNDAYITTQIPTIASAREQLASGSVPPEKREQFLEKLNNAGLVGTASSGQIHPRELAEALARNDQLYTQKQSQIRFAAESMKVAQTGGVVGEEGRKSIAEQYKFGIRVGDPVTGQVSSVPVDMTLPGHQTAALEYVGRTQIIPEAASQYIKDAQGSTDPERKASALSFGQAIQKTLEGSIGQNNLPAKEVNEIVSGIMREQMGQAYEVMVAIAQRGVDASPAEIATYTNADKRSRQNSDKPDDAKKLLDTEISAMSELASESDLSYFGRTLATGAVDALPIIFGENASRRMNMFSNQQASILFRGIAAKSGLEGSGIYSGVPVMLSPGVYRSLEGHVKLHKDQFGDSDRRLGQSPERQGVMSYLRKAESDLSFVENRDKNGNIVSYELVRNAFHAEANKASGTGYNAEQWNELVTGVLRRERPQHFDPEAARFGGTDVDPNTVHVQTAHRDDGTPTYAAFGWSRSQNASVFIANIKPDDPAFKTTLQAHYAGVAREMGDSRIISLLSSIPLVGTMEPVFAKNILDASIQQASGRELGSKQWADLWLGLKNGLEQGPAAFLGGQEYKAAWSQLATEDAQKIINRYGGLAYLLGMTSPDTPGTGPALKSPVENFTPRTGSELFGRPLAGEQEQIEAARSREVMERQTSNKALRKRITRDFGPQDKK